MEASNLNANGGDDVVVFPGQSAVPSLVPSFMAKSSADVGVVNIALRPQIEGNTINSMARSPLPEIKKARGRPRKVQQKVLIESPATEEERNLASSGSVNSVAPAKRGRGRPRKVPIIGPQSPQPLKMTERRVSNIVDKLAENLMKSGSETGTGTLEKPQPSTTMVTAPTDMPKKKRGRPKKNPAPGDNLSPKKEIATEDSGVKRGRGRPRKVISHPGVGRPKKIALEVTQADEKAKMTKLNNESNGTAPAAKEREVTPTKEEKVITVPVVAKRGPGRPRKHPPKVPATNSLGSVSETTTLTDTVSAEPPRKKKREELPKSAESACTQPPSNVPVRMQASNSPPKPKRPRGRPPKKKGGVVSSSSMSSKGKSDPTGKIQVTFSDSESDAEDPMEIHRSAIEAITDRVVTPSNPRNESPLFGADTFEESYDEDSDN